MAIALDRLQGEKNCGAYYGDLVPTLMVVEKQLKNLSQERNNLCGGLPKILCDEFCRRFSDFLELSGHQAAIIASVSHHYHKLRWLPDVKRAKAKSLLGDAVIDEMKKSSLLVPSTNKAPASTAPLC